jgi:imidazoleglycerol-phosphate dehydratase
LNIQPLLQEKKGMTHRHTTIERKSKETQIKLSLNVDGKGHARIKTPIPLLDHMLELFAFHGFFDIDLDVMKADTDIDIHHTNEDIGIVLGKAFKKALGEDLAGIRRFGSAFAPMEETVGRFVIDISGRGYFRMHGGDAGVTAAAAQEGYAFTDMEHFLESFAHNCGATVNVCIEHGSFDLHTTMETVFKAFGLALDEATRIDPRREGRVPSSKGIID